jgi:hypothetical protein
MDLNGSIRLPVQAEHHTNRGLKTHGVGMSPNRPEQSILSRIPVSSQQCVYGNTDRLKKVFVSALILLAIHPCSKPAQPKEHGKRQQP